MAWITPPDFVNGQIVTETQLDILSNDLTDLNTRVTGLRNAKYVRAELKRSDGSLNINASGFTDLKVYNAVMAGATWNTIYNGSGIGLSEPGLYQITVNVLYSAPNNQYLNVEYTSDSPAQTNVLGGSGMNAGYCSMGGTDYVYVPPADGTFGVTFRIYNNNAACLLNPNGTSVVTVVKIAEP